jgi:uncharacterized membrane protein HdeD (DUF308 family)
LETRGGVALTGALLIVVGILCMVAPKISGSASIAALGALLALSGLIEIIGGAPRRGRQGRTSLFGGGLFAVVVGAVMFARPHVGMAALTLLLAAFFFASGLFPLASALSERGPGWPWEVTFGGLAIILGVVVLATAPSWVALWFVGTWVGIEIVIRGATLLGSAYRLGPSTRAPSARPA